MQNSGVDAAIRELEREVTQMQDVITKLKRLRGARVASSNGRATKKRRLSPQARRRIAQAAKKRWAAFRAAKN